MANWKLSVFLNPKANDFIDWDRFFPHIPFFFLVSKTMASGIHSQHVMIGRCSVCFYHRLKFVLHFLFCMSRACTRHNKVRSHQRLEDFEKRYRTFYYLSLLNLDLVETWFRFLVFGLKLIFLWIDKSV